MHTETGVLDEMRVGEQLGPLTVGITHLECIHTDIGTSFLATTGVEKEQMIKCLVASLPFGILAEKARELFLGKGKIVEFVLKNHT